MKTKSVLVVLASLLTASVAVASEIHDADHALETNLRQTINQHHVHIDVHHGIVTIKGHVRTTQDRLAIESIVRSTPGVAAVRDKLKVNFPTPGTAGGYPPSIPVYAAPPPAVPNPAPVVSMPAPVMIPDYPQLKVQAATEQDAPMADRIAQELRPEALPASGLGNATITIRNGTALLQGFVNTPQAHDALIAAVQRAGSLTAIYDQLQVR